MKKKYLITLSLLATVGAHAQIGINNTDPKASLHITPQKTDGSTAEGIIAPNLTRAQLISKDDRYTAALKGAIVYVTTVDGTVSTKTAKIKGSGYYYFDGSIWQPFSQAETIVPPQPWLVQGGTTQATGNNQDIYQSGSVAVGSNTAGTYKFQVTGTSHVTENSRVGSSTVVGAQTVGSTLGVTGATTLANTLKVTGGTNLNSTLSVLGATTIASTGSFALAGNGAGAGKYLASDASGKGTWTALPAATVTTANNGVSMSGTTTQLGGALTKATTISGTGANTLTVSAPSILSGALRISSGSPGAGKYLTSDAAGNATWGTLPATATNAEPWQVQGGTSQATSNTQNIYQKGGVAIGSNVTSTTVYDKSLYVNGATLLQGDTQIGISAAKSNIVVQGNSTVYGTSIVTGNTTIGQAGAAGAPGTGNLRVHGTSVLGTPSAAYPNISYVMQIYGKGTVGGLWVENHANLRRSVSVGESLTATDDALVVAKGKTILNGATTIASTGSFTLQGNGAGAGKYLASDATGKGTWTALPAATVTTANNGLSMSGTTTQLGGVLTKATTITGTAANTLTIAAPTSIGTAAAKSNLNVYGNEYISGSSKIGGANTLNASAQLELGDNDKGLLINRVALVDATDKTPVVNAVDGMVVYNTTSNLTRGLAPGLFVWKNNQWNGIVDKIPQRSVNIRNLETNVNSVVTTNPENPALGALMNFGTLVIPEDGSYAFTFRLYGGISPVINSNVRAVFYIYMLANNIGVDAAEIDIHPPVATAMSYSVTLACSAKAGQAITFRLAHYNVPSAPVWTLRASNVNTNPVRTSMVWWKL